MMNLPPDGGPPSPPPGQDMPYQNQNQSQAVLPYQQVDVYTPPPKPNFLVRYRVGEILFVAGLLVFLLCLAFFLINDGITIMTGMSVGRANIGTAPLILLSMLGMLAGGGIMLLGAIIAVFVPPLSGPAGARSGYASLPTILSILLLATLAQLVLQIPLALQISSEISRTMPNLTPEQLNDELLKRLFDPVALLAQTLVLDGTLVLLVWLRVVYPHIITWKDMGLNSADFLRRLGIGVAGGVILLMISAAIGKALEQFGSPPSTQEQALFGGIKQMPLALALVGMVAIALVAPIGEEIFFRGYVFTGFARQLPLWVAYVLSALIFAIPHLQEIKPDPLSLVNLFVPLFVVALGLAFIYNRTGSIIPSIIAHIINNAVAFIAIYFSP